MNFFKQKVESEKKTEINFLFKIIKYIKTENYKKIFLFGLPIVKKNINDYKKVYILGVPFSYNFNKKIARNKSVTQIELLKNMIMMNTRILRTYISSNQATIIHPKTFGEYKGCFADKDIVIVACGPTISFYSPQKNAVFIGINRAFKVNNIMFDFLFAQDQFLEGMEEINSYRKGKCKKFYGWLGTERTKEVPGVSRIRPKEFQQSGASMYILEDIAQGNWAVHLPMEPLGDFQGAVFSALQFSCFTNPKRIFLVGCDCSSNYFYDNSAGIGFSYQLNSWRKFKNFVSTYYPEIEIISINPVVLRGLFHDVYTQSYLKEHPELNEVEVLYE